MVMYADIYVSFTIVSKQHFQHSYFVHDQTTTSTIEIATWLETISFWGFFQDPS